MAVRNRQDTGRPVKIKDEGITLVDSVSEIDFTGDGISGSATGSAVTANVPGSAATGDVVGPASATDNAVVRFDAATGKLVQNSGVIIDDSNNVSGIGTLGTGVITAKNTSDAASVQIASFEGDRATMADNDEAYISLKLSDDGGTQAEFARMTWVGIDVNTGTSLDSALDFSIVQAGTLVKRVRLFNGEFSPFSSDATALGSASRMWSDLFLASGAVINFNNGDVTLTHSTDFITLAGGGFRTTAAGIGINKANSASIALEVKADATFTQGMRVEADASTRLGLSTFVTGDSQVRFTFRADGLLGWGDGTVITDTNLFRNAANELKTDDAFVAALGIFPASNDGAAIGSATVSWSDLFLASGAVINFNNGDVTLTHSSNAITLAGGQFSFGANTAYFTETDNGNSSTADTIDWTLSNKQKSTLTGNVTFTFTAPGGPCSLVLKLVQDATGSRLVTWPAAVIWPGDTAPTLTTAANAIDLVTFYYDGTNYYGNSALNYTP